MGKHEDLYLALIRELIETGTIQWLDEPEHITNFFYKWAFKSGYSGYNFYIREFVKIQLLEFYTE